MNVEKTTGCPYADDGTTADSYLGGELGTVDAEAFEEHYLSCDRCWAEVRATSALRAALGRPAVIPLSERPHYASWSLIAAAAVLAIVGLSVWQIGRQSLTSTRANPVFRGASAEALFITVSPPTKGQTELSWTAHDDAQTYRVEVFGSDGTPVWTRETRHTSITFDRRAVASVPTGTSLLARVEAIDATGRLIATSASTLVPTISQGD